MCSVMGGKHRSGAMARCWVKAAKLPMLLVLLSSCTAGPNFKRPAPPIVERYTSEYLPDRTAATSVAGGGTQIFVVGQPVPAEWWTLFGSPEIDELVRIAFARSPSIASAKAVLRQAQENLNAQRGVHFPSIDVSGQAIRQRSSGSAFAAPLSTGTAYTLLNASVAVAYQMDLFGGARRATEASAALSEAQWHELQAAYLTLAANVVTSCITEASLRDQISATQELRALMQEQVQIAETRAALGAAAHFDVLAVESSLASLEATLPELHSSLATVRNQLAVYLGLLPSDFSTHQIQLSALVLPQTIPLELPARLVRQRPDVLAAEARLHRASALIGVASANRLPQLVLNGTIGTQSVYIGEMFTDVIWSLGSGVTQPLFRGGTLSARHRQARAAYDEALADYRTTVLTAYQNVADALTALHSDAAVLHAQHVASSAAKGSLDLIRRQYELGGTSYLNLLVAQNEYHRSRINYSRALANRYRDTAALLLALGGALEGPESREVADKEAAPAASSKDAH